MTTTTPHTLSQFADIGAAAALVALGDNCDVLCVSKNGPWNSDRIAREAFAKAVLDAAGYKFPEEPERAIFDAWFSEQISEHGKLEPFKVWEAGREELRKAQMIDKEPSQS